MTIPWTRGLSVALGSVAFTLPAWSAEAQLRLDLPVANDQRAARPYVAVWLERAADHSVAGNLAVWYDLKKRDNRGVRWLRDLREWWRQSGSRMDLPVDGVSGATRAPGEQILTLSHSEAWRQLPPGSYEVVVEAAREHGGHDLVRLPLQWPPRAPQQVQAEGRQELGRVQLLVTP